MKKIIFIKLGGSLITEKDQAMKARANIIQTICTMLAEVIKERQDVQFVIGNGAGSFGHYQVIQYNLKEGITRPEQWYGYSVVQDAVAQLNRMVVEILLEKGVAVTTIQPSAIITADDGKPAHKNLQPLYSLIKNDVIPSLYGDIILDTKRGCTIFSTEKLFDIVIDDLQTKGAEVESVIHLTQVSGVLDSNHEVIPRITKESWPEVQKNISATEGYDITGGMKHKIETALEYAKKGIKTYVLDGNKPELLRAVLIEKKETECTVIE